MYQPHPAGGADQQPSPAQPSPGQPPQSILTAIKLMYAGAVISGIYVAVQLISIPSARSTLEHRHHPRLTAEQIHSLILGAIIFAVLLGLITIGLWILMVKANGAGKPWARIVACVLFALSTIEVLTSLRGAGIGLIIEGLIWVVGLAALVQLWRRDSSAYYKGI